MAEDNPQTPAAPTGTEQTAPPETAQPKKRRPSIRPPAKQHRRRHATAADAVRITQAELVAICSGRTDEEIGKEVRLRLRRGAPPRYSVDLEQVYKLRGMGCTIVEICAFLRVPRPVFYDILKRDQHLREVLDSGYDAGNVALRHAQWEEAIKERNTGMLIWLGKNRLDQKDFSHHELTGEDGGAIKLEATVRPDLSQFSDDELRLLEQAARKALPAPGTSTGGTGSEEAA